MFECLYFLISVNYDGFPLIAHENMRFKIRLHQTKKKDNSKKQLCVAVGDL